jgi:predicted ATPase
MRIVGVSGAQGCGKSSLLEELKARGYQVDDFKVSRTVQKQLGWEKLDTVMDNWETMKQFQEAVLKAKYEHDLGLKKLSRPGTILTERTFFDISAYTVLWVEKFIYRGDISVTLASEWFLDYLKRANAYQLDIYDVVINVPLMSHIPVENDPRRAARVDAEVIEKLITTKCLKSDLDIIMITKHSISDRADEVESALNELNVPKLI